MSRSRVEDGALPSAEHTAVPASRRRRPEDRDDSGDPLQAVVRVVRAAVRHDDEIGRFGGDELAIVQARQP